MKNFFKKLTVFILCAAVISCMGTLYAADVPSPNGYTVVDTCYSPELGVYIAVTKKLSSTEGQILYSENGENWSVAVSLSNTKNYAAPSTRQVVVWWAAQQKFVAALGSDLYESADGKKWRTVPGGFGGSNTVIETDGEMLVVCTEYRLKGFLNFDQELFSTEFAKKGTYGKTVGLLNEDTYRYVVFDGYQEWRVNSEYDSYLTYTTIGSGTIYDMVHSDGLHSWILIGNGEGLVVCNDSTNGFTKLSSLSMSDGTSRAAVATAVGVNGAYIVEGSKDGKVYIAEETSAALNAASGAWEEVMPIEGTQPVSDEIFSITAIDDETFFFSSGRKLYKIIMTEEGWRYHDIMVTSRIVIPKELLKTEVPEEGSTVLDIEPQLLSMTGEQPENEITSIELKSDVPSGIMAIPDIDRMRVIVDSSTKGGHVISFDVVTSDGMRQSFELVIINQDRLDVIGFDELVIPDEGEEDREYKFEAAAIGTDGLPMLRKTQMRVVSLPDRVDFDGGSGLFTVHSGVEEGIIVLEVFSVSAPDDVTRKEIKLTPRHTAKIVIDKSKNKDEVIIPDSGSVKLSYIAHMYDQIDDEMLQRKPLWSIETASGQSLNGISMNETSGALSILPTACEGTVNIRATDADNSDVYDECSLKLFFSDLYMAKSDLAKTIIDIPVPLIEDLTLAKTGEYGSKIIWQSSDETILDGNGKLTRPSREDKEITLTQIADMRGKRVDKTYKITVKKAEDLTVNGDLESGTADGWTPEGETEVSVEEVEGKNVLNVSGTGVAQKFTFTNDSSYAFELCVSAPEGEEIIVYSEQDGILAQTRGTGSYQTVKTSHDYRKKKDKFEDTVSVRCSSGMSIDSLRVYEITNEINTVATAVNKAAYSKKAADITAAREALAEFYDLPVKEIYKKQLDAVKPESSPGGGSSGGGGGSSGGGGGSSGGGSGRMSTPPSAADKQTGASSVVMPKKQEDNTADELDTYLLRFKDMKYHWAREDVEYMGGLGLISGSGEGLFLPDDTVTRAEFAALTARSLGLGETAYENSFFDIVADDWFSGYVQTMRSNDLMNGYDGLFEPNAPITREEIAKVIVAAYNSKANKKLEVGKALYFNDIDEVSYWAYDYIAEAAELGFVNGVTEELFAPKAKASRAEAAVMLRRMYDKLNAQ